MKQDGLGALYTAYEELKQKLEKEGLFDKTKKQKIPFMPKTIGVLTSKTGSVIKDIINVSTRRNPNVYLKIFPIPVQGEGAALKIAEAIKIMNVGVDVLGNPLADVIILARGGGSLEDLWPFNEEIVARAIYDSKIPIISAVGHETDFTIADFVADLRAPTPSAAAELAVTDVGELKIKLQTLVIRGKTILKKKLELMKLRYEKCINSKIFKEPLFKINEYYMAIDLDIKKMQNIMENYLNKSKTKMIENVAKLDTLSPLKTLTRGYCIAENANKKTIKSIKDVKIGEKLNLRVVDGKINIEVI